MKVRGRSIPGALLLTCLGAMARAAQPIADTGFSVETLAPGVHVLQGYENNLLVCAGDDGIVLVDAHGVEVADKLQAALKTLSTKPIRFVINTHLHGDHSGGNTVLQKLAPVIAHDNVRTRLEGGAEKVPPEGWPMVTFSAQVTLHLNGEKIRILKIPAGHTDGDSVVIFTKANVVHVGDAFIAPGVSFGDRHSGGGILKLIEALEFVLPQIPADAKVVPGHGAISSRADIARGLDVLKEMKAIVERGLRDGKSMEQLVADKPLEKFKPAIPWFMSSTDGYVKDFYRELTASGKAR